MEEKRYKKVTEEQAKIPKIHDRRKPFRLELEVNKKGRRLFSIIRSDRQPFPLGSFSVTVPIHKRRVRGEDGQSVVRYRLKIDEAAWKTPHNGETEKYVSFINENPEFQKFMQEVEASDLYPREKSIAIPLYSVARPRESVRAERSDRISFYRRSPHREQD